MARYEVHRLIQNLTKVPRLMERLVTQPHAVFDEYGLNDAERNALAEASPSALASIGVYPILQMLYLIARNPDMAGHVTIRDYHDILSKES